MVIKADIDDHAPQQTDSGLLTATSLAAAVDGSDTEDSWFVGTIVAIGPLVQHFDCRKFVLRRLKELEASNGCTHIGLQVELNGYWQLAQEVINLPTDCPDPLCVGDRVTFSWASGQQMTIDDERFLILKASDVLAVLDKD